MSNYCAHQWRWWPSVAVTAGLTLTLGCATTLRTYSGPERGEDMVAVLRRSEDTVIIHVDGRHVGPAITRVELLPGEHSVGFTHRWPEGRRVVQGDPLTRRFDAQPGHTYEVRGAPSFPGRWFGSIVDVSQGTVVSYP